MQFNLLDAYIKCWALFSILLWAVGFVVFINIIIGILVFKESKTKWLIALWFVGIYLLTILTALRFDTVPYEQAQISAEWAGKMYKEYGLRIEQLRIEKNALLKILETDEKQFQEYAEELEKERLLEGR